MKPLDCSDLYSDPVHYDAHYKDYVKDIKFYLRQISFYGEPVLELGCGTGRITIPIAEAGYDITGLELLSPMVDHAKKKAADKGLSIEFIRADCRDFNLERKFNCVIFPFNALQHLSDDESLEAALANVKKHLAPEGLFVIDVMNPDPDLPEMTHDRRFPITEYIDPYGKGRVIVNMSSLYDSENELENIKWYYKIKGQKEEVVVDYSLRVFYPERLNSILEQNGFGIIAKYGQFDESHFIPTDTKQIVVCEAR
ncbi:MAG: class I SAM-dependent methyltransferase [bacterium]|nr:class I SAM-dependent methyltransferase [bacterium]